MVTPGEPGWSVSVVGHLNCLRHLHALIVVGEGKFELLVRKFQTYRICLGLYKETEGSVVDVVCDWYIELVDLVRAEYDVKSGFLPWRNHLAQRCRVSQFWILVDHQSHVDILPQIIRNVERFDGSRLHEHVPKVYLLGPSRDLLKLLAAQFLLAIANFGLRSRLSLKFLLDNAIVDLGLASAHAVQVLRCGLILANRLLNVELIHFVLEVELGVQFWHFHANVRVISNLFNCLGRSSLSFLHLFYDSFVSLSRESLMLNHHVESVAICLLSQVVFDVFFFVDELVLVECVDCGVHLGCALLLNSIQGRLGCNSVIDQLQVLVEIVWASRRTSYSLGLLANGIRSTLHFDRNLVDALQDLKLHLVFE